VLVLVMGMSMMGSLGMFSDRTTKGAKDRVAPVIVPVSGHGVVEQEMDGPEDRGAAVRDAGDDPLDDTAPENRVPRFLGTFTLGEEPRAIFEVQGATKPWMGKAGERIEGTEFLLEAFDASSARIVPIARH
jgi:hypothetical protein